MSFGEICLLRVSSCKGSDSESQVVMVVTPVPVTQHCSNRDVLGSSCPPAERLELCAKLS